MIPFALQDKGKWRHVDGGLDMSKKRLGEFVSSMLRHGGHIGNWWAFQPEYRSSLVCVTIFVTDEIEAEVLKDCPWLIIRDPPTPKLA